jgi:hypothetical protein
MLSKNQGTRRRKLSADFKEKYDIIYNYEQQFAYRLAKEVVRKPETSAWMILMPVLFVHHMFKITQYKANIHSFAENILSVRLKALDKAFKEAVAGKKISYGLDDYFPGVSLSSDKDRNLADKQLRVIRVMEEHYLAMLEARGKTLEELTLTVYRNVGEYRRYLSRLAEAEKEVSRYLMEHFHTTEESMSVAGNIEKHSADLRELDVSFFFRG